MIMVQRPATAGGSDRMLAFAARLGIFFLHPICRR